MSKKMNVESFNLDHTKVKAPYIRLVGVINGQYGDKIYKYDLRFCQPNKEYMDMPTLHSLEHMLAEFIRNHLDNVIDLSPMGCQTGFYLTVLNNDEQDTVFSAVEKTLSEVLESVEVSAANEIQCGNAKSHDLQGAKTMAEKMLAQKDNWSEVILNNN